MQDSPDPREARSARGDEVSERASDAPAGSVTDPGLLVDGEEAALRRRWRALVDERLPAAAKERPHWPVRLNHCFARILLDDACDAPWRERLRSPAWREAPPALLVKAIATGEAVLSGEADLALLDRRSLRLRGKA